jgi:hypothetical protein
MTLEIELEHHHLTKPVKTQTGNPETDYYLDIIYRLELKAYETLKSRKRNDSGKIGNTKGNRWKQSSAEFFNSLASQGKDWIDGKSSFPYPWSFKQWQRIRSILKDTDLRPYQDKIEWEQYKVEQSELKRKAAAYDTMMRNNGNGNPQVPICNECSAVLTQAEIDLGDCLCDSCNSNADISDYDLEMDFI